LVGEEAGEGLDHFGGKRFGGYGREEKSMETRMFDRQVMAVSTDGEYVETFNRGELVKNITRIGRRVIFEPVSTHRIVRTYAMNLSEFERATTAVREAHS
jgi:hypothetical protein